MSKSAADRVIGTLAKAIEGKDDHEDESISESPLFANRGEGDNKLESITVVRLGPVHEGTVGKMEADGTEEEILRRWGGGKYKLIGKNARGKPLKGANDTIEIAGEPRLKTRGARLEYRRMLSDGDDEPRAEKPQGFGIEQVLLVLTKQDDSRRSDWERRQEEAKAHHDREMERLRLEQQDRDKARLAEREREREDRKLEDERRRKDDEERERRQKRDFDEAQRRDREWFATMEKINRERSSGSPKSDPVELLMKGITLARSFGSDGDDDPTTAIVKQIPSLLKVGGEMVSGAIRRQETASAAAPVARGTASPSPAPSAPVSAPAAPVDPNQVLFDGELGKTVRLAVENLVRQGVDPEKALTGFFERIAATQDVRAAPAAAPVAASAGVNGAPAEVPAAPAAPVSPPVASETPEAKSATS